MRYLKLAAIALAAAALSQAASAQTAPQYTIVDLGPTSGDPNIYGVQANAVSAAGVVVGRTLYGGCGSFCSTAEVWTNGQMTSLADPSGTGYAIASAVANANLVAGSSYQGLRGNPLPVEWVNGQARQLTLTAAAAGVGEANGINSSGVVVGSISAGASQQAQIWTANGTPMNVPTVSTGSFINTGNNPYMYSATAINDAGLVVGAGTDPSNQGRDAGIVYNMNTGVSSLITVPGGGSVNGVLPMAISANGFVTGSASMNGSPVSAFIYNANTGTSTLLPTIAGFSNEIGRGVNSSGWVVGNTNTAYSNGFVFDGTNIYLLSSLITPAEVAAGWDFSNNTYTSADGISDNGTIVGDAVFDGVVHAYELVPTTPVPEPASGALLLAGLAVVGGVARRRQRSAR